MINLDKLETLARDVENRALTVLQLATYIEAANPTVVLGLIAELRKARAERDWLAGTLEKMGATLYELGLQCGKMYHTPRTKDEWVEISNNIEEAQNNDH